MAEYIEREAAIATACKGCNKEFPNEPCEPADCHIQQRLFKIPAADVVEVRHGEWIESDWVEYDGHSECVHYHKQALCCSECRHCFKKELLWKDNYCPNCGVKMDGKGEGANG